LDALARWESEQDGYLVGGFIFFRLRAGSDNDLGFAHPAVWAVGMALVFTRVDDIIFTRLANTVFANTISTRTAHTVFTCSDNVPDTRLRRLVFDVLG
jgi:hypothetical protein